MISDDSLGNGDDRIDLTDPQTVSDLLRGFGHQLGQLVEGQQKLVQMTNMLSGETLALTAILQAMRKKTGVAVTVEEAMDSLDPMLKLQDQPEDSAMRRAIAREVERLLSDGA